MSTTEVLGPRTGAQEGLYSCTFCWARHFNRRVSWARHEAFAHQYTQGVICPRERDVRSSQAVTGRCIHCDLANPTKDHIEFHRPLKLNKTFSNGDIAEQHMKEMHKVSDLDAEGLRLRSSKGSSDGTILCGFCQVELLSWKIRVAHVACHFENGLTKDDWTGV